MCPVAGHCDPAVWGSSTSGFQELDGDRQRRSTGRSGLGSETLKLFVVSDVGHRSTAQQFGQPAGVNLVTLVAFPHGLVLSWIAHDQFRDVRLQEVVQPGGPGPFFKGETSIHAAEAESLKRLCLKRLLTISILRG